MPAVHEVKILADDGDTLRVGGYGVVWGGKDLVGDSFGPETDLWLDKLSATPPVLFDHGQDDVLKRAIVGRVESTRKDDVGLWIEAKLSTHKKYLDAIRRFVKENALGWSSGAVGHLVERAPGKRLTSWAIAEFSLTTTPAEPRTLGVRVLKSLAAFDPALLKAIKAPSLVDDSYEDLQSDLMDAATTLVGACCVVATFPDHVIVQTFEPGDSDGEYFDIPYTMGDDGEPVLGKPSMVQQAFVPDTDVEGKATLTSASRDNLGAGDFAYIDSDGGRHLPINDAGHVRAAMSRFNQTHFESPDKKKAAARKIRARASALGIDISADSAVAMAAKGGAPLNDLPDSAFAFIEPGGALDEERKTVPRAHRHFAHHDYDGSVDVDAVKSFLAAPDQDHGDSVVAHMMWHARQEGLLEPFGFKAIPDGDAHAQSYTEGTAGELLATALKALALADMAAQDREAMARFGMDSHDGQRLKETTHAEVKATITRLATMSQVADEINRGEDGAALVAQYRTAFALLDLEEVA